MAKAITKEIYYLFASLAVLLFFHCPAFAQKEGNNWYFGDKAAITFNTNPPSVLFNSQGSGYYGHATMSDANGNLLFYFAGGFTHNLTPNRQVLDRNHQPMPNGSGLFSNNSPSYIIPWPGTQKYFLFTYLPGPVWNCYSIIDMSLNNGFGDITSKNIPFNTPNSVAYHHPVVVKHKNNRDYWLICPSFINNATTFYAYSITPAGLNLTPVISTSPQSTISGGFKASPDGRTLIAHCPIGLDVFNFDPASGNVNHRFTIGLVNASIINQFEFSPDGTNLFMHYIIPSSFTTSRHSISQFDLTAPTANAVQQSAIPVPRIDTTTYFPSLIYDLQLGPDGKIYIIGGTPSNKHLGVIHRPNLQGRAAILQYHAVDLDPNNTGNHSAGRTFPHFISGFFYRPKINMQQTCFGDTAHFSTTNNTNIDSVKWNFGDPVSGTLNQSTSFTPKHFYATGGSYTVQTIVYYTFSSDTLTQTIFIPSSIVKPNLGKDTTLCLGDTLRLNAFQPGASYEWQDSINTDPVYLVTKPGTYWVQISNGCGTRSDTIVVNFHKRLQTNFPPDTILCIGQSLLLQTNNPGGQITWQDGSTQPTYTVTKPGKYFVQVQNVCGNWADTIQVNYRNPVANKWLPKDTVICSADTFRINGTNPAALMYRWQDGSYSSYFTAKTSGTYWLEITTTCSTVRDSINVIFNKKPASRFRDTTICTEYNFVLTAPNALSYRWNTGETSQAISISKAGRYKVILETAPGCFASDSVNIKTERCIIIPNIITPNNDQLNDKFEFKGLEAGEYELSIYNRWGTQIYHHENYTNQWPNKQVSDGTYYYLLRNKQTGKTYKGWVEIAK